MTPTVHVTAHAIARAGERFRLSPDATRQKAAHLWRYGLTEKDATGARALALRSQLRHHPGSTCRWSGRQVWWFLNSPAGPVVVTVSYLSLRVWLAVLSERQKACSLGQ